MSVGMHDQRARLPNSRWAVARILLKDEQCQAESSLEDVVEAFRGITRPMGALGLSPTLQAATSSSTSQRKTRCPLVALALFLYTVRLLVAICSHKHDLTSFRALLALGHVFRAFASFLSAAHLVLHRESLRELVAKVHYVYDGYLPRHTMQLERFTKLFTNFCIVSALALFCALFTNAFSPTTAFPYQNFTDGNSAAAKLIHVILVSIDASFLCLSKTVQSLTIVFFAALCYMFSKTTLRFMLALESASPRIDSRWSQTKGIEDMLLRLSRASDTASALNHIYGAMMSLWYADLTAGFLLSIPSSILAVSAGSQLSEYAFALVDITRDMTVFIAMTFVASEAAKNVSDSLHYALRLANSAGDRDGDLAFTLLVKILVCHIQDAKVELSGADFFVVDRALINAVLLLVSTFAIIVYQFLM